MTCTTTFAGSTRQENADRRKELDQLCAQAAAEAAKSREVIAEQDTLIGNLREQIGTLQALVAKDEALAAALSSQIETYKAQLADAEKIRREYAARVDEYERREKDYRNEIDKLRGNRFRDIVITALIAAGITWAAANQGN